MSPARQDPDREAAVATRLARPYGPVLSVPAPFAILRRGTRCGAARVTGAILAAVFLAWAAVVVAPAEAAVTAGPAVEAHSALPIAGHHATAAPDPVDVAGPGVELDGEFPSEDHFGGEALAAIKADALAMAGGERAAGWLSFLPGTDHSRLADGPSPTRGPPSF